ncbi:chaperonin 10-like protein [Coniochaeta sp. 2T2.1]|nr:chaperonin 10-like protein [Coniochaeta sp. 2T2.1]
MDSQTPTSYPVYRGIDGHITTTPRPLPVLAPNEILIRITHSGVCYSDYEVFRLGAPLALGHEGVGIVQAVGSSVKSLKPGDRAGGGFYRSSCGNCKYCNTGRDILCHDRTIFTEGDYDNGTFGEFYVGKEGYVYKIPEEMASEHAAPLQCAGATVYAGIVSTVKPGDRVGVVGVGGLGHLAIQFAAKMGAEVVVFSTTGDKEAEAREFGASEFVLIDEPGKIRAPVQVLLVAGSRYPDWDKFAVNNVLARDGIIVPFTVPSGPLTLPSNPFFWQVYHIRSSLVASKAQHQDMLEFAAHNGIKPLVQVYDLKGPETIEKIFEDLKANRVRYRAVVKV